MPTKQTLRTAKRIQSKAAFVLGLPLDTPAKEVVTKAKEAGLKLRQSYVYVIRSTAKARARRRNIASSTASATILVGRATGTESQFRRIALELGLGKAKALLRETEQKVAAIIAGR